VTVVFGNGFLETFEQLPEKVRRQAAHSITLLSVFPHMYPIRRQGLMRGYRYFVSSRFLFYYSVTIDEIRMAAIIPGPMGAA